MASRELFSLTSEGATSAPFAPIPSVTVSWSGGAPVSFGLSGKLPPSVGKVFFSIGAKRVVPDGDVLDVRYDDVFCDVE